MKKIALLICFGVVALSCNKEVEELPYVEQGQEVVGLTVRVTTGRTRAADTSLEDDIVSLQVFIFADGVLESVAYSEADSVNLRCFSGFKDIYAVVNSPELDWVSDMTSSDLKNTVVMLSEEKTWNVMVGNSLNVYAGAEGAEGSLSLTVNRLAARISLAYVGNGSSADEGESITVHRAYITNVAGIADLSGVVSFLEELSDPTLWYNKMGDNGDLPSILSSGEMSPVTVEQDETGTIGQYFYCYPNPYGDDDDGWNTAHDMFVWSPRSTRLVVEAEYKGVLCYYPVTIKGVMGGVSYNVMLTIEGYGAADPEGYVWYYVDLDTGELVTGSGSGSGSGGGSGGGSGSGGMVGNDDPADPFIPNVESYEGDVVPLYGGSAKVSKSNLCM